MKNEFLQIALLFLTSLAGGGAAFFFKKLPKNGLKAVLAFSGAYILGITALHLLGDVFGQAEFSRSAGRWILVGFFIQLLLDFLSKGIEHGHVHAHDEPGRIFIFQIMLGLCLHAFFEGLPLGGHAHFHAGDHAHGGGPSSLLVGIVLHEIPASFTLASLLLLSKFEKKWIWAALVLKSSMAPIGLVAGQFLDFSPAALVAVTAIVIGLFLHIATTILFEADSSAHHNLSWARLGAIAAGVFLAFLTVG